MATGDVLFELSGMGDGVRVVLGEPYAPEAADLDAREWVWASVEVTAAPFAGTVRTILVPDEVRQWREAGATLDRDGAVTLGGNRAPEFAFERHGDNVEVRLATPSADAPDVEMTFLVFAATSGTAP